MASYTYPVQHPEGSLTQKELHLLLSSPKLIARRVAELSKMRFIADFLLAGRFDATGGGIFYETETADPFAEHGVEAVAPGGEYPRGTMTDGTPSSARTVKWGLETAITDEKIARQGAFYVNKSLSRLANSVIRHVDSVAMSVIAAKISTTHAAGSWTAAGKVAEGLLSIQQERADLGTGLALDTVVLPPAKWAKLVGILIDDKALPREAGNPVVTGTEPLNALGFTWVTSPHYSGANPLLVDRDQLGGMANEKLGSPNYHAAGDVGVEALSKRDDDTDSYDLRARRVTVPVVTEPLAGVQLTGTGL